MVPDGRLADRISAALLGGAIADAMGWPTESLTSPEELKARYGVDRVTDFIGWEQTARGWFDTYVEHVRPGEYSDDTQLALCTARSIRPDGRCDVDHFATRELPAWLAYARGAGPTTSGAAKALRRKSAGWNRNFFTLKRGNWILDYRSAGSNGAAMRIGPIAMANARDPGCLETEVWRNTIITHGHPRAIVGALMYARALAYVLTGVAPGVESFLGQLQRFVGAIALPADPDLADWRGDWDRGGASSFDDALGSACEETSAMLRDIAAGSLRLYQLYERFGCFDPATRSSATATVAAALATFLEHGADAEHAILEAVNMLGSDTDTIAAMVGSLAAARAGFSGIPDRWARRVQDYPYFMRVAPALARIADRQAEGPELLHGQNPVADSDLPDVRDSASHPDLMPSQRVRHEILGAGTIRDVDVQQPQRRQGGRMLFVFVEFDCGQSCRFKFFGSETSEDGATADADL